MSKSSDGRPRFFSPLLRTLRQRPLVVALTKRELSARYRGSALGFVWSLINPLLLLLVYATVFRFVFTPRADVRPYALFLFGGVLVWGFVSGALMDSSETFRSNGPLLRKTTAAPEVFPAVSVAARFTHLLLALPVLGGAIAIAALTGGIRVGPALLQFPLILLLLVLTVHGIALAVSCLAVRFGDVRDLVGTGLTLLFFLTPILYSVESVPERWRPLLRANPFASYFAAIHESSFFFRPVGAWNWAWMFATSAIALIAGAALFERLRDTIAEEA